MKVEKLFWYLMIVAVSLVIIHWGFAVYRDLTFGKTLKEVSEGLDKDFDRGLKFGWEAGLLEGSIKLKDSGLSYDTIYSLSQDTILYQQYLRVNRY